MAGTCKILSFFVTTTAGEDETCEGNPEHSKRDAVDVAPSEPAPENDAAAEPTTAELATAEPATAQPATAEPAGRGPGIQELDLTLDKMTNKSRSLSLKFQLGSSWVGPTMAIELRSAILHHEFTTRFMSPKRTIYPKRTNDVN